MNEEDFKGIVQHSCPGAGACGGMYTANTMASAIEALGMSLPYSSSNPALSEDKKKECAAMPESHKIITGKRYQAKRYYDAKAFENAITVNNGFGWKHQCGIAFDCHGEKC